METFFLEPTNCECGRANYLNTRIAGGTETGNHEYPWTAFLRVRTNTGRKFRCTGVVISTHHVLTAAHCLLTDSTSDDDQKNFSTTEILLGKYFSHKIKYV